MTEPSSKEDTVRPVAAGGQAWPPGGLPLLAGGGICYQPQRWLTPPAALRRERPRHQLVVLPPRHLSNIKGGFEASRSSDEVLPTHLRAYPTDDDPSEAEIQFVAGVRYAVGAGARQDWKTARKWIRRAADQGHGQAQVFLGDMYSEGRGVEQDFAAASRWYRRAATSGNAYAQNNLGANYALGSGVIQDFAKAERWLRMAAAQDHAKAQHNLGLLFAKGLGQRNEAKAALWFSPSWRAGSRNRSISVGRPACLGQGLGAEL